MRRTRASPGRAHLKTGSLRDVVGIAGYVLANSGRRYVVVAIVNHPNANAARPALDALVQWAADDGEPAPRTGRMARPSERVVRGARQRERTELRLAAEPRWVVSAQSQVARCRRRPG